MTLEQAAQNVAAGITGATVLGKFHKTEDGWLNTQTGEVTTEIPV
jgi:hypothetical protein